MGCIQSKERVGLVKQHEEIARPGNNNKPDGLAAPPSRPPPSRHSPPVGRGPRPAGPRPGLEGLGGLEQVWGSDTNWDQFRLWLAGQSEGDDSEGVPLLLSRYALWLELYAELAAAEAGGAAPERVAALLRGIITHPEGFLDSERCLACWDGGLVRTARAAAGRGGAAALRPLYPRVIDWLAEKLGSYQNKLLAGEAR